LKGQIASLLIVVALIVGAGVGYFGSSTTTKTTTETVIRTYTTTLPGESGVERCVISGYTVWAVEEASSSSTIQGTSTQSSAIRTYQTSTSAERTVGFETTTMTSYTGTLSGPIAIWNSTACTFISG
jgi:hypothetical protein